MLQPLLQFAQVLEGAEHVSQYNPQLCSNWHPLNSNVGMNSYVTR